MDGSLQVGDGRRELPVLRVRQWLSLCELEDLRVRSYGAHVLIEAQGKPVARITELSRDAYGLSFQDDTGRWEMLIVDDSLDEVMSNLVSALETLS